MRVSHSLVSLIISVLLWHTLPCRALGGAEPDGNVIETFTVDGSGDALMIPVTVRGQEFRFILDTGTSISAFDKSLRPMLVETNDTIPINETENVHLFKCENATVGKSRLPLCEWALCLDLASTFDGTGCEVHGILGTDFLRNFTVQLDFDAGQVRLLRSADKVRGKKLPMGADRYGCPTVTVHFDRLLAASPFLIDTGDLGLDSGGLGCSTFDALVKAKQLAVAGTTRKGSVFTARESRFGIVARSSLGEFEHLKHYFSESDNESNSLGLGFLSRYLITLDFPNRAVFFEKGKQYNRTSTINRPDVSISFENKTLKVLSIDERGTGYTCGLRIQDQILEVDGHNATQLTRHSINMLISQPVRAVRIRVKSSDNQIRDVELRPSPLHSLTADTNS